MGLCPHAADRSCKAKISNLISKLIAFLFQEHIFRLDISMDEILLVDALECFHDLHDHLGGMLEWKYLCGEFGLIGEQVALFAVFHDNDDEIVGWIRRKVLVNSYS